MDRQPDATEVKTPDETQSRSLNMLDLQIRRHEKLEQSQSVLAKGVKAVTKLAWSGDDDSLSALKALRQELADNLKCGNQAHVKQLENKVAPAIQADFKALSTAGEIGHYGNGFVKTAALFSRGRIGMAGTVFAYGLDQMHRADSTGALDFCLGAGKGLGMKAVFNKLGEAPLNPAAKGVSLGFVNTGLETILSRESYRDAATGGYSFQAGFSRTVNTSFDLQARGVDAAVFVTAHGLFGGANWLSAGALERSKVASNLFMGTSFGMSSGASQEYLRQRSQGESFDGWKIAERSMLQGMFDTAASAVPMTVQGRSHRQPRELYAKNESAEQANRSPGSFSERLARGLPLAEPEPFRAGGSLKRDLDASVPQAEQPSPGATGDQAPAARFSGYSRQKMNFEVAAAEGPFSDYVDFLGRGRGFINPVMRTFELGGNPDTKIIYSDAEARYFSALKVTKHLRERAGEIDVTKYSGPTRAKLESIMRDAGGLERCDLATRLSPLEALQIVKELPDARLVKRLTILNERHWQEPWRRHTGQTNVNTMAEVLPDGSVTMYRPPAGEVSRDTLFHEWAHLLKFRSPTESNLFDRVGALEPLRTQSKSDLSGGGDELWAVHVGEGLLNRSSLTAIAAAYENPIRSSLAGRALSRIIESVPEQQRSPRHAQFQLVTRYIEESVRPLAQQQLLRHIEGSNPQTKLQAIEILGQIGDASHLPLIERAAAGVTDPAFAKAVLEARINLTEKAAAVKLSALEQVGTCRTAQARSAVSDDATRTDLETRPQFRDLVTEPETTSPGDLSSRRKQAAYTIVERLQSEGHVAVLVGGCVRDEILGRTPRDYDIASSATPEQIQALFGSAERTGKGTGPVRVFVNDVPSEVSSIKRTAAQGSDRLPAVDSVEQLLRLDAARRDLTSSAIFKDPISGKIYDFYGGQEDLRSGVVRTIAEPNQSIAEDPYRMLRAVRIATELGFELEPKLLDAVSANAFRVNGIKSGARPEQVNERAVPADKVRDELLKVLGSRNAVAGLDLLMKTGLMKEILPEVVEMNGPRGEQDPRWHPEGNAWVHTRGVVEILSRNGVAPEVMLAGLLHDIGKPDTQVFHADGRITNTNHAAIGAKMASSIARRLDFSPSRVSRLANTVRLHMTMHKGDEMRPGRLATLLEGKHIADLISLQDADAQVGNPLLGRKSLLPFYTNKLAELAAKARESERLGAAALVTGKTLIELGHKPGPNFKLMLNEAREAQIEGVFGTAEAGKDWARTKFGAGS
jgi:poly(A) polymerase